MATNYNPNDELKRLILESEGKITATTVASEEVSVKEKVMKPRKKAEKKGTLLVDTSRMSEELQNWILEKQIDALSKGLTIEPKKFMFQMVNASETNMDFYGKWKEEIMGRVIKPVIEDDEVVDVTMTKELVEVPVRSALYPFFKDGTLEPVRMRKEDWPDPQLKLSAYQKHLIRVFKNEKKILIGNIRQSDPVLWIADIDGIKSVFGYNILKEENPFKVSDLWRTTTKMVPDDPDAKIRIRFVDKMEIYGVPRNDGCIFGRMQFYFRTLPIKRKDKNGVVTETIKTIQIKSCCQTRLSTAGYPLMKDNMYLNDYHYFSLCKELNFDPYEADIISTFDNVKNKFHDLKHGDIVEISLKDLRVIGIASSKGKSSFGIQLLCMGKEVDKFQDILIEKGITEKASEIAEAMTGKLSAIAKVLSSQSSTSTFEDSRELYMRCALFAMKKCVSCGVRIEGSATNCSKCGGEIDWYVPMITKNVSNLYVRLNSMMSNELMKTKVSSFSPYIMPWVELDHLEKKLDDENQAKSKDQRRNVIRFYCPPNNPKMRKQIHNFMHTILGANPVVAPFSVQTFVPIRANVLATGIYTGDPKIDGPIIYNSSKETIEISNQSAYMMIRDFDGDKVSVCFTNCEPPRTYRTIIKQEESAKGPKPEPPKNMTEAVNKLLKVSTAIAQAAQDTGLVDLKCRARYIKSLMDATKFKDDKYFLGLRQAFNLGWLREKEIQGQKWVSTDQATISAVDRIEKEFGKGVDEKTSLEYKLVHRHAGLPVERRSDRNVFTERINIINKEINTRLPHWPGFVLLRNKKVVTRHSDSQVIRVKMTKIWNDMVKYHAKNAERLNWNFSIQDIIDYGQALNVYFNDMSSAIMAEYYDNRNRKLRAENFRILGKNLRTNGFTLSETVKDSEGNEKVVSTKYKSLEDMREIYGKDVSRTWERYLAVYICTIAFGGTDTPYVNRFGMTVNPYSLGGGALGYLSNDATVFVGMKFNPDNPELVKARAKLDKLAKRDTEEVAKNAGLDESEDQDSDF